MENPEQVLADGKKLMREIERRQSYRTKQRQEHKVVRKLVAIRPDGTEIYETMLVKRKG